MNEPRFYVYRIFSEAGETLYIGKGCGRRLANQTKRFGAAGEIVRRFSTERAAYRHEAELIAQAKPPLNKCAGGGGAVARRKIPPLHPWFGQIKKLGSRVWLARELLKLDLKGRVDEAAMHCLRAAAAGNLN